MRAPCIYFLPFIGTVEHKQQHVESSDATCSNVRTNSERTAVDRAWHLAWRHGKLYSDSRKSRSFCYRLKKCTVRDNLFRICNNLGQHPPFFSKMRTFFKNRALSYHFDRNSAWYHGGQFLTCSFKKSFFFL
jgi:hypothetical protein